MADKPKSTSRRSHSKPAKKPVTIDLDAKDVKKFPPAKASGEKPATTKNESASKPGGAKRSFPPTKPVSPAAGTTAEPAKAGATASTRAESPKSPSASKTKTAKSTPSKTEQTDKPETSSGFGRQGSQQGKTASSASTSTSKTAASGTSTAGKAPTASTSSSPQKSVPAKPEAKRDGKKSGWGNSLLAACIGGIAALGLAGLLQYAGILSTPGASGSNEAAVQLESRGAELESEIANREAPQISSETAAGIVEEQVNSRIAVTTERIESLESALAQTRDQIASLPAGAPADADVTARLNELSEEIASLQAGSATSGSGASEARLNEISGAVERVESELTAKIDTVSANLKKTDAALTETNARLEQTNATLDETLAKTGETNTEITALRDRVENGADRRAAAAIAAATLKSDIDSGQPFANALANLRAFAPGMTDLQSLASFVETGVPTTAELTAQFEGRVSDAILAATAPKEDGSLASRLAAGARSLVEVKPIGELEGESPQARVSQIATALKNSDLSKASETWTALPEEGREASSNWHERLKARLTANSVVNGTIESVLNSSRGG